MRLKLEGRPARLLKALRLTCIVSGLTACQQLPSPGGRASTIEPAGQAFAQASCGRCHAVGRHGTSPNSNAPPFEAIVNKQGLTKETLSSWLRDAHTYPREMRFRLDPRQVDDLAGYMLTLSDAGFRPPT